jgi:hypothetical protein
VLLTLGAEVGPAPSVPPSSVEDQGHPPVYTRTASRARRPQRGGLGRGVQRGVPRVTSRGWYRGSTDRPAGAGTSGITDPVSKQPVVGVAGTAGIPHIGSAGASGGSRSAMARGMQVIRRPWK